MATYTMPCRDDITAPEPAWGKVENDISAPEPAANSMETLENQDNCTKTCLGRLKMTLMDQNRLGEGRNDITVPEPSISYLYDHTPKQNIC